MKRRFYIILSILALAANTFAAGADIAGGRISKTSGSYEIQYFITDHLGSTRVVVNQNGVILGTNDYYPFGKRWEGAGLQAPTTRWLFSGKEMQTSGEINYMDFGSRMYDDFLGRWFTHDPKSYRRPWESPYGYCGGNPVARIDPDGQAWWFASLISGAISWVSNGLTTGHWGIKSFLIGAAAGLVGAGVGAGAAALGANSIGSSMIGGMASGAVGGGLNGGSIAQGAFFGGLGGLAGGITNDLIKTEGFWTRLGVSTLSGGVVSGTFSAAQGGKFWNGFAIGAAGAAAGFLGNELCDYLHKRSIDERNTEAAWDLKEEEIEKLKHYGLKELEIIERYDTDGTLWNKANMESLINDDEFPFSLRKSDFDRDATAKRGHYHWRKYTEKMGKMGAYKMNGQSKGYMYIHYDHFDVVLFPLLHWIFDSKFQQLFHKVK